ncbi:MAG: ACP S-malonyltransferase [Alicyclobacillaceae bacterium]|nr:ACP S-malonyltransferase [Alicyclobacillaceae bacterium]
MTLAFVFPGQGAQSVGMGRDLLDGFSVVRETFEEADEALGFALSKIFLEGDEAELRLTYHTQPALLTVGIAAWRAFSETVSCAPAFVAGHSLGEYTALVASGALPFAEAVRIVYQRGRLMDEAVPAGQGTMAAVLGLEEDKLAEACRAVSTPEDVVELANLNCPSQVVISGTVLGVERGAEAAKAAGARRVIPLVVSGPFHCSLMRPAASRLSAILQEAPFMEASVPVVANVNAKSYTSPAQARQALTEQLYSPVRWQADVEAMLAAGVNVFLEFGVGSVLSGLIKKINRNVTCASIEDGASLAYAANLVRG